MHTHDAIDVDGVIYPFVEVIQSRLERRLRRTLPVPTRWEIWQEWGLSFEQFMDFFRELINDGEAFTVGAPVDGARDALARRLDNGAQVTLITARLVPEVEHLAVAATHHWLDHHRVPFTRLVVCKMNDNKARLVPDATGAVDDSVTQIRNWRDHGVSACLFDHPANRNADDPYRVIGWDQATTFLATR